MGKFVARLLQFELFPDFRPLYCGFVGWNLGVMSTAKVFNFHLSFSTWNVAYICTATASPESSQYYCGFEYFTRKFALSKILIKVSLVFLVITFLLKNNILIVRFFQGKLGSLCEDLLYYVCSLEYVLEKIFASPFSRDAHWLPDHKTYFTFCSTRLVESDTPFF